VTDDGRVFARLRPGPALTALVGVAVAVAGGLTVLGDHPYPAPVWLVLHVPGLAFTVAGLVACVHRPTNGTGRLMLIIGITWYVGDLQISDHPVLFAIGFILFHVPAVAFSHMVLALPEGRLQRLDERLNVGTQYVATIVIQTLSYVSESPVQPEIWGARNAAPSVWSAVGNLVVFVLTAVTVAQIVRRWRSASRPARREYALMWTTIVGIGALTLVTALAYLGDLPSVVKQYLVLSYAVGLAVTPAAILAGLLRVRMARLRVADLVVRLDNGVEPTDLRAVLAQALDDPTLELLFPLPGDRGYVDAAGQPVSLPPAAADRVVTPVTRNAEALAILVHDPALASQRPLVEAVVAAARLALDNTRLYAAQRAQLELVNASRTRLVLAADTERRRIQRDLHDGVQHKLMAVSILVQRARAHADPATGGGLLATAGTQLGEAIRELRELAQGIHPAALSEQGLAAAVDALAELAPVPVIVDIPAERGPGHVERAAYFMISEALANVYKHAAASQVTVRACRDGLNLVLTVTDDGVGGADPSRGTGLRGLSDRAGALGGSLKVESRPGAGTKIIAELPCVS
jgi:signal transduction histidine kinase